MMKGLKCVFQLDWRFGIKNKTCSQKGKAAIENWAQFFIGKDINIWQKSQVLGIEFLSFFVWLECIWLADHMFAIHSAQPPLRVVTVILTTLNTNENAVCNYFQPKYKSVHENMWK